MKKDEMAISALCALFFAFMLVKSLALLGQGRAGEVGSGFWPVASLSGALAMSLIWMFKNVIAYQKGKDEAGGGSKAVEKTDVWDPRRKVILSILCLIAYIVLLPLIGFILSTMVFILSFILSLGERRNLVLIISPILITAVVVAVFARFITIPLPRGAGIFAAFSRFFY